MFGSIQLIGQLLKVAYIYIHTNIVPSKLDLRQIICLENYSKNLVNDIMNNLQVLKWTVTYTIQAAITLTIGISLIELIGRIP